MIVAPIAQVIRAADLEPDPAWVSRLVRWSLPTLKGRLSELSGEENSACLSLACSLVLEAQGKDQPLVWVSAGGHFFYPPDMAANGVALEALPVVRVPDTPSAGRAADWLLRSGAFDLIILDLGRDLRLRVPLQGRLVQLARKYHSALLCLTVKEEGAPSLGSMVSLYARVSKQRTSTNQFQCTLHILKDKRHGPGLTHKEVYRGPDGLH